MRRLRDALRRDERGLSMTEVLVSMLLTSILLAAAGGMLIQVSKITTSSNQSQNSTKIGATVANEATTVIRVATKVAYNGGTYDAITAGTRSSITLYSNAGAVATKVGPTRITLTLNASGNVVEDRCVLKAAGDYWDTTAGTCAASSSRTIGQGIQAPGTVVKGKTVGQLFTYLKIDADGLDDSDGYGADYDPILIGTGSLQPADLPTIVAVAVEVWTQAPVAPGSQTTAASVIRNIVILRNLGLGPA